MNTIREPELVFPLSSASAPRPLLRAPRLPAFPKASAGFVLGHGAFMRAWSGRRARLSLSPLTRVR